MTERAPIRAVVRTAVHAQAVTCCVCQCGELLLGASPIEGMRCRNKRCTPSGPRWYSKADIDAAMRAAEQIAQPKEAA